MNLENLAKLRDALRAESLIDPVTKEKIKFSIRTWFSRNVRTRDGIDVNYVDDPIDFRGEHCGTVACIGGMAMMLMLSEMDDDKSNEGFPTKDWLGLTDLQLNDLTMPAGYLSKFNPSNLEAADAVQRVMDGQAPWPGRPFAVNGSIHNQGE